MSFDNDIKIIKNKPSEDVKRYKLEDSKEEVSAELKKKARLIGKKTAELFSDEARLVSIGEMDNNEMLTQRRILLSFTATVGFETYLGNDTLSGLAQKSFLETVKEIDPELYRASSEMGAFSFYYLAFRRGSETIRRIGQTFAMLCSHDGDPIFQEMGEALYCWFSSEVKNIITENLEM